jgi:copper resistance protein B
MDNQIMWHVMFDQLEGRTNGPDNEFRWDGQGWIGTDMNKLWFKSEGFVEHGKASDGDTEALYDRPIPFLRYFDAQAGVRYDLDSVRGRTWGAIGIQGLAPDFFDSSQPSISATAAAWRDA